jgi:hypothetical protein
MNATAGWMFLSVVISMVGLALFVYGKKQGRVPQLFAGILMMAYPYFVPNLWVMVAIGIGLGALLWLAVKLGW